jgi:hypothetical protein
MKGLITIMPDGSYQVKSLANDAERNNVAAYAVSYGTHTGAGGALVSQLAKKDLGLRLCDAVYRRQDQSHDEDWLTGMGPKELAWA